jgi:cell division protein FtsA
MGREMLEMPVRIGAPQELRGLVDILGSPAYATSVGLLLWGLHNDAPPPPRPSRNGGFLNLGRVFKVFLPD